MFSGSKALIAMSGGVDSSAAAYLAMQKGFDCIGGTMVLCQSPEDIADAEAVAKRLEIPFYIFDARIPFRSQVQEAFVESYEEGQTPNPCIICNRKLKFGYLLDRAKELGCSHIVTGHYARVRPDEKSGRWLLMKAADPIKDQSYFLSTLTQEQLCHAFFPLGELTKEQARSLASQQKFVNARKRDSQDICFIPDGDYPAFLERFTGKQYPIGNFLDQDGHILGHHRGAVCYTLGQRKGLGIAMGHPVYVCNKDMEANTVTVGPNEALFHKCLIASDWSWFPFKDLTQPLRCMAKARSRMTEQPATAYPCDDGTVRVVFDEPQRALTPGQTVALYNGETVIGGGCIQNILE
jgi:tRNA-specific 2-thiouridylase